MRWIPGMRLVALAFAVAVLVSACAAGTPASGGASPGAKGAESHPAEWYTVGAGRADFEKNEHDFDRVATDCTLACKALASLERAANHLCAVAEPDECNDARVRVDRARRAVEAQCGGC